MLTVCETSAASVNIGTDFCDQDVRAKRKKQRHIELDIGNCIPITRKPEGCKKSQPVLLDGLTYEKR